MVFGPSKARRGRNGLTPPPANVGGVLLLYRRPLSSFFRDAATIDEHIAAFARHSRFEVHSHNTELGFPRKLRGARFDAVVFHYSLFGWSSDAGYPFPAAFESWLDERPDTYKVAFFHDEHVHNGPRFAFLNRHGFDCVFTMLEPDQFGAVYGAKTSVPRLESHLPGYVGESMLDSARRLARPETEREVDVGFRARPLAPYMGVDEKTEMGEGFAARAGDSGLALDIEVSADSLLPGDGWYRFMARCRTMLGVESGTTTFDLEDEVFAEYTRLAAQRGAAAVSVEDLRRSGILDRWEDRIYYKTIGPRHFEAAAMGVPQVLFEGRYSGLMEPMTHFIPLARDFSNFDEAVARIRDPDVRTEIASNARRDLIDSGEHTYAGLIARLDGVLEDAGISASGGDATLAERSLKRSAPAMAMQRARSTLSYHPVLSRMLYRVSRPVMKLARRRRR